jgi:hypothetical protein
MKKSKRKTIDQSDSELPHIEVDFKKFLCSEIDYW